MRRALAGAAVVLAVTGCTSEPRRTSSGAGVEAFRPDRVLAEQTLRGVKEPADFVDVAVTALRVEGRVMLLELAITPRRASVPDRDRQSLIDLWGYVYTPELIDRATLQRYEMLLSEADEYYASDPVDTYTVNRRPMRAYYYFAAPRDKPDVLDVVLSSRYPPLTDVPVSR